MAKDGEDPWLIQLCFWGSWSWEGLPATTPPFHRTRPGKGLEAPLAHNLY